MTGLRWGFLGNADIATSAILPALAKVDDGRAVAIASRNREGAEKTARSFGIDRVHADYGSVLADDDVDAVYIGLPNSLHLPWIRKAIEAGKHVLCEKPITVTASDAEGLAALADSRGLLVQEALMTWSHPRWHIARELIRDGRIGDLKMIQGRFSFFTRDPANIRNQADLGGGALLDLGIYLVSSARFLFEAEPTRALAIIDIDPDFGTDRYVSFLLDFPGGQGSFMCSNQLGYTQRFMALGTRGHIDVETPFTPPSEEPARLIVNSSETHADPMAEAIVEIPPVDQYAAQLEAFAAAVAGRRPPAVPFESSVSNMRALDAIRASAGSRQWEEI